MKTKAQPDKHQIAVEQHLDALPAGAYQIRVRQIKGGQNLINGYQGTRDKIMSSLPWLKEQADQGAKITMRPLDSRYVLAHNLNDTEVDEFKQSGLPPSVVVETAPGKYQAWVKLSDEPIEPELSKRLTDRFAEVYGAPDPANLGRLAGFDGAKLHNCQPQTAPKGSEGVDLQRKKMAEARPDTSDTDHQTAARPTANVPPDRTKTAVINHLNALPAETYEIAVRRRIGDRTQMIRHQWRRSKIMTSLPWLKRENAAGADILSTLTPMVPPVLTKNGPTFTYCP